jgi:hypothetical protein
MGWSGAKKIPLGRHVLTIVAIDKLENTSTAHLAIVHLREQKKRRHHRHRRHH